MKAGKLELLLTVSAEVIEGLAKFQLSKAVQTLFSLRKTDLTLLEAELKAPGRELAFVVQARETFGA